MDYHAKIIDAFRRDLFNTPVVRASADQMAAHMRDTHGEAAREVLADAARMLELFAVEQLKEDRMDELFIGIVAAAMLLRAASGE